MWCYANFCSLAVTQLHTYVHFFWCSFPFSLSRACWSHVTQLDTTDVLCDWTSHTSHHWSRWSCVPLCYPMDCNPPGSSVHGIPQARILEWAAVPFPRDLPIPGIKPVSCVSCSGRRVLCPLHHLGSPMVYYRLWTITPGAVQEELLFIHSVCNGLCLHIHTHNP